MPRSSFRTDIRSWEGRHQAYTQTIEGYYNFSQAPPGDALEEYNRVTKELQDMIAEAIQTAVISGVRALLDHSAECSIDDLRDVDYRGGKLVFYGTDGDRIFKNLEIDDRDVAESFSPKDARAFVREFRRLKASTN